MGVCVTVLEEEQGGVFADSRSLCSGVLIYI